MFVVVTVALPTWNVCCCYCSIPHLDIWCIYICSCPVTNAFQRAKGCVFVFSFSFYHYTTTVTTWTVTCCLRRNSEFFYFSTEFASFFLLFFLHYHHKLLLFLNEHQLVACVSLFFDISRKFLCVCVLCIFCFVLSFKSHIICAISCLS